MKKNNLVYWEQIFSQKEWGKYPPLELVRFIAKNFYAKVKRDEIKILELGSGPGANLWYLAREGFSVYGIEGSQTACDQALLRLKQEGIDYNLKQIISGDYLDMLDSYPNNFFDAIIDIESIYCNSFEKSQQVITKSFDKLKPEGKFFSITFANKEWITDMKDTEYHAIEHSDLSGYFRYTTKDDIEKLYKNHKSEIESIEMLEMHLKNGLKKQEWIIELKKICL